MMPSAAQDLKALIKYCKAKSIPLNVPWKELRQEHRDLIWKGNKDFFGVVGLFDYLEQKKYKMHVRVFISRFRSPNKCTECNGSRLRKDVENVKIAGKNICDLTAMTIHQLHDFLDSVELTTKQLEVSSEIFKQLKSRLDFLLRVGVHYLTLSREAKSLSGGEYQRLILANQLGMGLSQVLYVLDEPTVGLHPRAVID